MQKYTVYNRIGSVLLILIGVVMRERDYQSHVIRRLRSNFPGCFIQKNDSGYVQGVPDLIILFFSKWAMLEVKASKNSPTSPNQEYYIEMFNQMSYASFIYPENEEEVLDDLQHALGPSRSARLS